MKHIINKFLRHIIYRDMFFIIFSGHSWVFVGPGLRLLHLVRRRQDAAVAPQHCVPRAVEQGMRAVRLRRLLSSGFYQVPPPIEPEGSGILLVYLPFCLGLYLTSFVLSYPIQILPSCDDKLYEPPVAI